MIHGKIIYLALSILILVALIGGCQTSTQTTQTEQPTQSTQTEQPTQSTQTTQPTTTEEPSQNPPVIVSTHPADGETLLNQEDAIEIRFSEPMDKSATEQAFSIIPEIGSPSDWVITWEENDRLMVILFPDIFGASQTYIVTVTKDAKSAAGIYMAEDYTFKFTSFDPC